MSQPPPAPLVDTHAHPTDPAFAGDLPALLERARDAGVAELVCVGYDLVSSRAAVELAQLPAPGPGPRLWSAAGIHPNSAAAATPADFRALAGLARQPGVVAIGETGLDYLRDRAPRASQRRALEWHLRLAEALDLPVVVHNRQADADLAPALEASAARRRAAAVPGVLHCFSSTDPTYLTRMLDAGYFVSFAGTLTFKNAEPLRAVARRVPLSRLLVETDCPFLAPEPRRGRRNEPALVRHTAERLAALRGLPLETLAGYLWANSCRAFALPGREGAAAAPVARRPGDSTDRDPRHEAAA